MPLHITDRDLDEAHRYARDAVSRLRGVGKADGALSRTTRGIGKYVAVGLGAATSGLLSGYKGSADVVVGGVSVPLDGLGGLLGLGASVFMEDGIASEGLANYSAGLWAAFVTKYTIGYGKSLKEKGGFVLPSSAPTPPALSAPAASSNVAVATPLSVQQLASMATGR
jgi:hypothetical protein